MSCSLRIVSSPGNGNLALPGRAVGLVLLNDGVEDLLGLHPLLTHLVLHRHQPAPHVPHSQCFGSVSGWIRIQIARLDPDPYSESGSWKWNWAIKIHFFQIFHDFHLFLKILSNKSFLFSKIPTWLVENENKIQTFWIENKNSSQNFVFALKKLVFCCPDPESGSEKNPESGFETLELR